ncbi:hypothetical protein KKG29_00810, partial [Patescibacteria group bacterium]|nr:hypothetical protein [Patescibacteria group bacterium]
EYDFWGISIKNQKPKTKDQNLDAVNYKSKWQGITKFKTGFGGKELTYPKAMDFVFQRELYHLIKFAKGLKKLL